MNCVKQLGFLLMGVVFNTAVSANIMVQDGRLPNGLRVVVTEDHRAPVVAVQLWVKVGGVDEENGSTGISHALEHMMFKGTPKHPGKSMADEVSKLGGEQNAVTTSDYTYYFTVIGRNYLPKLLELEADRFANLSLEADAFTKEFEVVKEERRMRVEDNPRGLLFERFDALSYTTSPYRRPVIGWPQDLQVMKIEDLRNWYKSWYVPNNVTLVVSGDVTYDEVIKLAQSTFGAWKNKALQDRPYIKDEPPLGAKSLELDARAAVPTYVMGYLTPVISGSDKDPYVLDLISALLDLDESGRLSKHLKREKQVASSVFTSYNNLGRGETVFALGGVPAKDVPSLEAALLDEIALLQTKPVDDTELSRAKTALIAKLTYAQDDISSKASLFGQLAVLGVPLSLIENYPALIKAITAEDIQRVAKLYFTKERMSKAWMNALPASENQPKPPVEFVNPQIQS